MKKKLKLIIAFALALVVLFPTMSFTAQEPTVRKTLNKSQTEAVTPTETFIFNLSPATVAQGTMLGNVHVSAGTTDLLTLPTNTINYSEADNTAVDLVKTVNLEIKDDLSNVAPGIYRYNLSEVEGTTDGMTYDTTQYTIDVYVTNDGQGGKEAKVVSYSQAVNPSNVEEGKVNDLEFENTYDTKSLSVTKELAGNAANLGDSFSIDVTVNGTSGEKYATDQSGVILTSGTTQTFTLSNNDTVVIYGLSENDTYTVVEPNPGNYTKAGEVTTATAMGTSDTQVTVTNTLEATVPTGVIETIGAFAIMIVAAGGFAFIYFKLNKKRG